jgi:hypothetical protein
VVGVQPACCTQDADLEELLQRLSARDAQLQSLDIAFTTNTTFDASTGECNQNKTGVWLWRPDIECLAILRGCIDGTPVYQHSVWDGSTLHQLTGRARWDSIGEIASGKQDDISEVATIGSERFRGGFSDIGSPSNLGLFFAGKRWSEWLSSLQFLQLVGHDVFAGSNCAILIGDLDNTDVDGHRASLVRLRIDQGSSLLVLSTETYYKEDGEAQTKQTGSVAHGNDLRFDGETWHRRSYVLIDELLQLPGGAWIGRSAHCGRDDLPGTQITTTIDPNRSFSNQPLPEAIVSCVFPQDIYLHDMIMGIEYFVGHQGDDQYSRNRYFRASLESASHEVAHAWSEHGRLQEPIADASLVSLALYTYAWLNGGTVLLRNVLSPEVQERIGAQHTFEEGIPAALQALGFEVDVGNLEDVKSAASGWCLGIIQSMGHGDTLLLFRRTDDDHVQVLRPGGAARIESWIQSSVRSADHVIIWRHPASVRDPQQAAVEVSVSRLLVSILGLLALCAIVVMALLKLRMHTRWRTS